jgi:HJR/Mrr/RecB family endonuclease
MGRTLNRMFTLNYILKWTGKLTWYTILAAYMIFKFALKSFHYILERLYYYLKFRNTGMTYEDILQRIKTVSPREFELLCGNIFKACGYYVEVTEASNDYGRDIILNNNIYVECKHYSDTNFVGREICQKLIGSCASNGIKHGIVITTGTFHENAYEYKRRIEEKSEFELELWTIDNLIEMIEKIEPKHVVTTLNCLY